MEVGLREPTGIDVRTLSAERTDPGLASIVDHDLVHDVVKSSSTPR